MLADLTAIPAEMVVCAEWKPQSNFHMRRVIGGKRSSWDQLKVLTQPLAVFIHGRAVPKSELAVRKEFDKHEDTLGDAMVEIENAGNYFGAYSMTVLLLGTEQPVRAAFSEVAKVFGRWDAALVDERLNLFRAFLSVLPGNYSDNSRHHYLLNVDFANLLLMWNSFTGNPRNEHLHDEYLCAYETNDQQLFYFNGHVGGVFGIQILGAPESGKSFNVNALLSQMQKYNPITLIMDIGGSYKHLTAEFGGSYLEVAAEKRPSVNPFALANTEDNRQFLYHFVRLLVGRNANARPDEAVLEDKRIAEGVEAVYMLDPEHRRLGNLILPGLLGKRLARWQQGGQYPLFDSVENDIRFGEFTTFEFQGMERYTDVLVPLSFLITQQFLDKVYDRKLTNRFKCQVFDECWRFMLDGGMGEYLLASVKTFRKHNGGTIMVTQSGLDAERTNLGPQLREACPMTIFHANPTINTATYEKMFRLNDKQARRITTLKPKRELAILTPQYFKVVSLQVDNAHDIALFSNDPNSNQARRAAIAAGA